MNCKICGGTLSNISDGYYKCKFCGAKFTEEELAEKITTKAPIAEAPAPMVEAPSRMYEDDGAKAPNEVEEPCKAEECTIEDDEENAVPETIINAPALGTEGVDQNAAVANIGLRDHGVDVFESNINGVLEIQWSDDMYIHSGSGLLITQDGYALTNTHVVSHESGASCKRVTVRLCGEAVGASVICLGDDRHGNGNGDDLAIIKLDSVPKDAHILRFDNFENVRIGERVFVIGNSLGYGTCMTNGIVSDKKRDVNGKMLMMTDCAVNGGNSGGPIFNDRGLVIGVIVSGISDAEGMNFAIPADTVMGFLHNSGIDV